MGECGCAQEDVLFVLPGPGDVRYGVEIYSPCRYCYTPLAVNIYRFRADDDEHFGFVTQGLSEPTWQEYFGIGDIASLILLDMEKLGAKLAEVDAADEPDDLVTVVEDVLHEGLQESPALSRLRDALRSYNDPDRAAKQAAAVEAYRKRVQS